MIVSSAGHSVDHCGNPDFYWGIEMDNEELLEAIESVANFMRGMQFDQRIPSDAREALRERAMELDDLVEKYQDA